MQNSQSAVQRECPVCGQADPNPYLEKHGLKVVSCKHCSMLYANPVPKQFASGEYYDTEGADYYLSPAKLESDYSPVRFERELRLFRKYCASGSVLDVGCGSGAFLFRLKQRFGNDYSVLGTDVSGAPLDYAESKGVPVLRGNFLEQDFSGKQFDAVTFWAVLEHLAEPRRFLEKAASLLKPNGVCCVLVPNMKSLAVHLLGGRYRYIYLQHLNYFTSDTLGRLAEPWFSVIETQFTHFNPIVIWQDWRSGGAEVSNKERGDLLKRTTQYKTRAVLKPVRALYCLLEASLAAAGMADNVAIAMKNRER
ncbi:MAG TPA: class I SAM-dependent methyltransferase [Candidatus Dormibacteraeota bacterium]|nr:class I SAM-dependent methyltransferase [Candidatus Dormibacteraeota bacterium]